MSGTDIIVARLDTARIALAEAATPRQAKAILDIAEAAKVYAKRQNLGSECIRYATELTLDAERKLGQMLKDAAERGEREKRGGDRSKVPHENFAPTPPT